MSGPYGLTAVGFVGKTAPEIKADLDDSFAGVYGESLKSEPDGTIPAASSIGQEEVIIIDAVSSAWQVLQAIYAGFDSDQAVTPQLQILCALTGVRQKGALHSSAIVTCVGVNGTILPVGRVVTVTGIATRFLSQSMVAGSDPNVPNATLQLVTTTWAIATAYAINALVTANGKIWQCTTAGTSAGGGGPTGAVGTTQTDNTVSWFAAGLSTQGVQIVPFEAEDTGALSATVGQLVTIATPVSGWATAYNTAAADEGRDIESDYALRVRRNLELQLAGGGPADAIRADILAIPQVEQVIVFVNSTDVTVDTIPPHGVEVLIQAPTIAPTTDAELALAVWRAVGAGTATSGNIPETVKDASGNDQVVSFSRPVKVPIYASLTVYYDAAVWTGSGAATSVSQAVKAAIMNYALTYAIGQDARSSPVAAAVLDGAYAVDSSGVPILPAPAGSPSIPGLLEVRNGAGTDGTLPYIGMGAAPVTSTAVAIAKRSRATIDDLTHIVVTATSETP